MQEDEIKQLLEVWYEKARMENNQFSRFVFLWICFNVWIDYRSGKDRDAEMIDWLTRQTPDNSDLVAEYEHAMQTEPFRRLIGSLVAMAPVLDSRGGRPPVLIRDNTDRAGVIRAIYRIRCNLFHGGKNANNPRDQKLVLTSQRILDKWLGNLVGSWRARP